MVRKLSIVSEVDTITFWVLRYLTNRVTVATVAYFLLNEQQKLLVGELP